MNITFNQVTSISRDLKPEPDNNFYSRGHPQTKEIAYLSVSHYLLGQAFVFTTVLIYTQWVDSRANDMY